MPNDGGKKLTLSMTVREGKIVMGFSKSTDSVELSPYRAEILADSLKRRAREIRQALELEKDGR